MKNYILYIILGVVLIAAIIGGYFWYKKTKESKESANTWQSIYGPILQAHLQQWIDSYTRSWGGGATQIKDSAIWQTWAQITLSDGRADQGASKKLALTIAEVPSSEDLKALVIQSGIYAKLKA